MTAIQRAVVDDLGNINVHGREGIVVLLKIETAIADIFEDISASDLFIEVSGKYRVALAAGSDVYTRQVVLTRDQISRLPTNKDTPFVVVDETPTSPRSLWAGTIKAYGFRTAPSGAAVVEGVAASYAGASVTIQPDADTPTVVVHYDGPTGYGGWSPVLSVAADGAVRKVLEVTSWIGGDGTAPDTGYVAAGGVVALIADADDLISSDTLDDIAAAGGLVTGVGGTIDVREDAAIAAIDAAEAASIVDLDTYADSRLAEILATTAGTIYADTTAGLAGTASGGYFLVVGSTTNSFVDLYLDSAGTAVFQRSLSSAVYVAALAAMLQEPLGNQATQTPGATDPVVILGNGNQSVIDVQDGVYSLASMPISGGDLRPFDPIPLVYPITRRAAEHIQIGGMSLADGDASTAYSTSTPVASLRMQSTGIRSTTLSSTAADLVEATQETVASRMGKELARRFAVEDGLGYEETIWSFALACQDSQLISAINASGTVFTRMDNNLTNAKTMSVTAGEASLGMHFLVGLAGGAEAGRARATIKADILTWQANFETQAQLRSGLADPAHLLMAPTNYQMLTYPNAALALFDADNASDKVWACFAEHMLWMYVADGAHYAERGYQYAGALFARAQKDIYDGHAPRRVWPKFKEAILRADGTIHLPYSTPAPLMKRYKGMLATTNDGYALTNAGAGVIDDVEIWRGNTVILHTTGVDPVTNPTAKVEYATQETPLLYNLTGGGFGNITDSTGEMLEFRDLRFPGFHAAMPHDALIRSIDA